MHCTMNINCLFFNHKKDNTKCELMNSHNGKLEVNPKWQFISTDYSDRNYRGPICSLKRPRCDFDTEYCTDSCNDVNAKSIGMLLLK